MTCFQTQKKFKVEGGLADALNLKLILYIIFHQSGQFRNRLRFKYLVRLDAISTPALYPEFHEPPVRIIEGIGNESIPQGYAKIRVHGEYLEHWAEFINSGGFLRR